jgi:hypothetical protein
MASGFEMLLFICMIMFVLVVCILQGLTILKTLFFLVLVVTFQSLLYPGPNECAHVFAQEWKSLLTN